MIDEKYIQRLPGGPLKAGTWVYDRTGRLLSVDGVPVPDDVNVYSVEVLESLPPTTREEEQEGED